MNKLSEILIVWRAAVSPYIKWMGSYLIILVAVGIILAGARSAFPDSMIIYAEKGKQDFLQVFFPRNDAYSEENSVRSVLFDNKKKGITDCP